MTPAARALPRPPALALAQRPDGVPGLQVLHPGDIACAARGERLATLLGSCVAIILTDPRRTVATMCHVVHARLPADGGQAHNTAYGEAALAEMARRLLARGIVPSLCEGYVMGGGNMFPSLLTQAHVGHHNVHWALAALARTGVRVLWQDTGGSGYRRIAWTVGEGAPDVATVQV